MFLRRELHGSPRGRVRAVTGFLQLRRGGGGGGGGGTVGRGGGGGHLGAPELDAPVDGGGQVEVREVQGAGRGVARHGGHGARVRLHAL